MKIVRNEKTFSIPFEDVGCGEIFEYDGTYWMKVFDVRRDEYYCVCVADGEICDEFEASDMCRVIKAELHILD